MISIIIPTYNRSNQLNRTLFSLIELKTARDLFEIIVVDNGSTDSTKDIIKKHQEDNTDIVIKYFYDDIPGLLTGRHRGAKEAKGEILTFIDDDVRVSSTWLDTIIEVMSSRSDISFLTGPNLPLYESYPPDWLTYFWLESYGGKYCGWLSLLDLGNKVQEIHPNFVWGLNFTIRKSVFIELKGFNPDCVPPKFQLFQGDGETGLTVKAYNNGYKALYHPDALLYHEVSSSRLTFEYFETRAYYQGVCNSFTKLRTNEILNPKDAKKSELNNKANIFGNNKRKLKLILKKILLINKKVSQPKLFPREISDLYLRLDMKEKEGYDYHQKMYVENESVRTWVHKLDFMNYKLPVK